MEKLPMCRICLAKNVHMHVIVNRNLHELYEKLTDIPFVTEDSRPILACYFCCAKLKQCYRFLRKCQEAEELFAQMMDEDHKHNPLINQNHLEFSSGFVKSPILNISIVDVCQSESIAIKEELPAACEALDDIIEPKQEHQSDELEPDHLDINCLDVADADLEDYEPLMEFKTEVEEELEVSKKKRDRETKRTTVAKKPKLDTRRTKLEDATTAERTEKDKSDSEVIRTIGISTSNKCDQLSFNVVNKNIQHTRTQIRENPYKCDVCQRSYSKKSALTNHIRIHTGEKPFKCNECPRSFIQKVHLTTHIRTHTGEKPYNCDVCQRSFIDRSCLNKHIRIHTGGRPYKCDVCQRSFRYRSNLTDHTRIHIV